MSEGAESVTRTPVIAGNWKMHKTSDEGAVFVAELAKMLGNVEGREVVIAPPFTGLYESVRASVGTSVSVAAQDVYWEAEGAFTGEVSPGMLSGLGVKAAIVGHSERRGYFGETDEDVARKVSALLSADLYPIMCVGEGEAEREAGRTEEVLARQVPAGLALVKAEDAAKVCVAYEPIWAIGTGRTATPAMAQEAICFVRGEVARALGTEAAAHVRILYGGSVSPDNIDALMAEDDIDGALVGGASLKVESFARIVGFQPV